MWYITYQSFGNDDLMLVPIKGMRIGFRIAAGMIKSGDHDETFFVQGIVPDAIQIPFQRGRIKGIGSPPAVDFIGRIGKLSQLFHG